MKNREKLPHKLIYTLLSLLLVISITNSAFGQEADIQDINCIPAPPSHDHTKPLTHPDNQCDLYTVFYNNSIGDIPLGSPPMTLEMETNKWAPDLSSGSLQVSGAGSVFFDWAVTCLSGCGTVDAVYKVIGTQNQIIEGGINYPPFTKEGGPIIVEGYTIDYATEEEQFAGDGIGFSVDLVNTGAPVDETDHAEIYFRSVEPIASPVSLNSFSASANDNDVDLLWSTTTESGNSHFDVQRSLDGSNFTTVGSVQSKAGADGNSNVKLDYDFTDKNAFTNGDKLYYRLKQVDISTSFEYSDVQTVSYIDSPNMIYVYPNPLKLGDDLIAEGRDIKRVSLVNVEGKVFYNNTFEKAQTKIQVPTTSVVPGSYMLLINDKPSQKIVIGQ